ncbi:Lar family restriction alleviation protein [Falsirhodobacter xinxiangensis]|uniref:Lar family restriction alleviation protein n=1 Tax=Falsirhodobacter xinxiangensis TaxID=2530049 RepID=UPI0010A9C2C7|nr:Lar family restriction alleviation protein [Rhodobacter xinxiangensis]
MDDLKAKIEALPGMYCDYQGGTMVPIDEGHDPAVHGDWISRGDVLALIATHAAEPAPVAVEGVKGELLPCPFCGSSGIDPTLTRLRPYPYCTNCGANGPNRKAEWNTRAALAPTGNTALVEAAIARMPLKQIAEIKRKHAGSDGTALSQPATPQPTPEVEALVYERDRNQASRQWHMKKRKEAEADRDRYKEMYEAALARGSVAEKGER